MAGLLVSISRLTESTDFCAIATYSDRTSKTGYRGEKRGDNIDIKSQISIRVPFFAARPCGFHPIHPFICRDATAGSVDPAKEDLQGGCAVHQESGIKERPLWSAISL